MQTFDIELYPNYILFAFRDIDTHEVTTIEGLSPKSLRKLKRQLRKDTSVTFNGLKYDMPVVAAAIAGIDQEHLYELSKKLISGKLKPWQVYRQFNYNTDGYDHIDLVEPSPDPGFPSLKLYGTRMGSKRLWELPYNPTQSVTHKQQANLVKYCENDLNTTEELYRAIEPRIKLREDMSRMHGGIDLRSKSDAQVAEAVILHELKGKYSAPDLPDDYIIEYTAPDWVHFINPKLKRLKEIIEATPFTLDKGGSPTIPKEIAAFEITIGESSYNVGIGGLHSQEKSLVVEPKDGYTLRNADIASMYPTTILNLKLFPKHLGKRFLTIYKEIYDTRLKAKADGNKVVADSLKIVLNGSYGKFGSKYSKLYSPDLLLNTTLTGQLALLMLIERLEYSDIPIISANTDGIEFLVSDRQVALSDQIIDEFETISRYTFERGNYRALYARDVNNYVAVYNGYTKAVGVFANPTDPKNFLKKNSRTPIVYEAIRQFLLDGTLMEDTIRACTDIHQFCSAQRVTGGAMWRGKPVGKVARWYYATDGEPLIYIKSGNKVAMTDGAKPLNDLSDKVPEDIDYEWYINFARRELDSTGWKE